MFFYNLVVHLYGLAIRLSSFFNEKARKWIAGRRKWRDKLKGTKELENRIWFHISSLGEFEQSESLLKLFTQANHKILITFFSPSGYEKKKENKYSNLVFYLPLDTRANAKDFIELAKPKAVIFVKYDFWLNHLLFLQREKIPTFVISFVYHNKQWYFKKWLPYLSILRKIDGFYVQNEKTKEKLLQNGFKNIMVTGDTRIDNLTISHKNLSEEVTQLARILKDAPCVVGGSVYLKECQYLNKLRNSHNLNLHLIIAPHILDSDYLRQLIMCFGDAVLWSEYKKVTDSSRKRVIIIDKIGLLKELYILADLVVVGGGFEKAIHNTLEPAAWGKVLMFGPKYQKFPEAEAMLSTGGAASFSDYSEFENSFFELWENRDKLGRKNLEYIQKNKGASNAVFNDIVDNQAIIQ